MTEEHKAALAAGRKAHFDRARAAKAGATEDAITSAPLGPPAPASEEKDELVAKIARLEAENADIRRRAGFLTDEEIAKLPKEEAYFEFRGDKRDERGQILGERIDSVDDPRWGEIAALRIQLSGSFVVNEFVRAKSGEILDRVQRTCLQVKNSGQGRDAMLAWAKGGLLGVAQTIK